MALHECGSQGNLRPRGTPNRLRRADAKRREAQKLFNQRQDEVINMAGAQHRIAAEKAPPAQYSGSALLAVLVCCARTAARVRRCTRVSWIRIMVHSNIGRTDVILTKALLFTTTLQRNHLVQSA